MNKTKSQQSLSERKHPKWLYASGIIIVLYLISLFTPLIWPYTQYPLQIIRCGKPPVIAFYFAGGRSYVPPTSKNYGPNFLVHEYFCNEQDAQRAYYSKSSLD